MNKMKKSAFTKITAIISALLIVMSLASCSVTIPEEITLKDEITDADTLRIMSFNIRFGEYNKRKNIVPLLIMEYAPDSIGIQECTHQWYENLTETLTDYEFIGVGRDTGDTSALCGEMSAILFRKDKFTLLDSGTFWLSETPDEVSQGWDGACRRICTWVILEDKVTGEQFAHVNTHLDHKGPEARVNGSQMVKDFALEFDMPVVVTGDFNFKKDTDLYMGMIGEGLRDTQDSTEDTMNGKTYHDYEGGEEGLPIDFIFVNEQVSEVLKYRIVRDTYNGKHSSDHYPIYTDIRF